MYTLVPFRRNVVNNVPSLFNDAFMREFFTGTDALSMNVDVQEKGDGYLLEADLPGVKKEDIGLEIKDGMLYISAEVNAHKKEKKDGYVYNERRSGHCERAFDLEGIDLNGIKADYQNGVLMVNLPKMKEEIKPTSQKIAIGDGRAEQHKLEQGQA